MGSCPAGRSAGRRGTTVSARRTCAHVIPGRQPDAAQMFIGLVYADEKEA